MPGGIGHESMVPRCEAASSALYLKDKPYGDIQGEKSMSRMLIVGGALLAAALHVPALQAQTGESFYDNKQISLVVGYNPGGTYDIYSRVASAWLPRYIPGNPKIIVRNMPGAGGAKAANFLYQQGSKDGLTIGMISQAAALQQVIQDPAVEYDVRKFTWLGRITPIVEVT